MENLDNTSMQFSLGEILGTRLEHESMKSLEEPFLKRKLKMSSKNCQMKNLQGQMASTMNLSRTAGILLGRILLL
jgi:hypothetical protein